MSFLGFLNSSPNATAVSLPNPSIDKQSGLFGVISKSIISSFKSSISTIFAPNSFSMSISGNIFISSPLFSEFLFKIIIPSSICFG